MTELTTGTAGSAIYDRNLAHLKTIDPVLTARMSPDGIGVPSVPGTADGFPFVAKHDFKNCDVVIILGIGYGAHIMELLPRVDKKTPIIIISNDLYHLRLMMSLYDCTELFTRPVSIAISESNHEAAAAALAPHWWAISASRQVIINYSPATTSPDAYGYYVEFLKVFKRELNNYLQNVRTIAWRSAEMHKNTWDNMQAVIKSPGVQNLFGAFPGKPCMIAAAGPSLTKQMDFIKQCRDRVVLLAVDTALKPLLAAGITPDIVLAVDYLQLNFDKVRGANRDGYYVAAMPQVVKDFYDYYADQLFVVYGHNNINEWMRVNIGERGALDSGGSVAHTALQLAFQMGCDPIVFVGLDLAFVDRVSHADNSIYHERKISDQEWEATAEVPSVTGGTVRTSRDMWSFIVVFEKMVQDCGKTVYNTSEGGALIKGMQHHTPANVAEALQWREPIRAMDIIENLHGHDMLSDTSVTTTRAIAELKADLARLATLSSTGVKSCDWLLANENQGTTAAKHVRRLKKVGVALQRKVSISGIMDELLMGLNFDHFARYGNSDGTGDKKDVVELRQFLDRLGVACRQYKKYIEGVKNV